jgi:hypothetical protein
MSALSAPPDLRALRDLIPLGTAARTLRVSAFWARTLCERGVLRGVKTPLGWLIDPESLEAERARRQAAGQEGGGV